MTEAATAMRSVIVERDLPYPPEKIWRALTQPSSDRGVADEERLQAGRGSPVQSSRGLGRCRLSGNLRSSRTKRCLTRGRPYGLESVVTWTLTPTSTGTHLRMEQSGFRPDQQQAYQGAKGGWQRFFAALEQVLARID